MRGCRPFSVDVNLLVWSYQWWQCLVRRSSHKSCHWPTRLRDSLWDGSSVQYTRNLLSWRIYLLSSQGATPISFFLVSILFTLGNCNYYGTI